MGRFLIPFLYCDYFSFISFFRGQLQGGSPCNMKDIILHVIQTQMRIAELKFLVSEST